MSIVLTKPKRAVASAVAAAQIEDQQLAPALSPVQQLMEEAGALLAEAQKQEEIIKKAQAKLKPFAETMKKLQAAVNALDTLGAPDQKTQIESPQFVAEVSKAPNSRSISDMDKVRKLLGAKLFMKLAAVKLTDLDAYLTPPQLAEVIQTSHGDRKVTLHRKT